MRPVVQLKIKGLPVLHRNCQFRQKINKGKLQLVRAQYSQFDNESLQRIKQSEDGFDLIQKQLDQFSQTNQLASSFDDIFNRQLEEMRQVERQMDQFQNKIERNFQELDRQMQEQKNSRQFTNEGANFQYKYESRESGGAYSRYERYQVIQSNVPLYQQKIVEQQQIGFSPLTAAAIIAAACYAAMTAFFAANYGNTNFRNDKKWLLLLMWPVLLVFSQDFRQQMRKALLSRGDNSSN
eukprot:TRINITY_DN8717_c0_g1_i1.p2 TRINITY_DN8717_c0_g1~~TRINITY_DN8717_c0_g1_i1.p2  ORF type:complete len:238 (-),score=25.16 TRINITY_DN8717_c0_g1_i1:695-1408(-)